MKVAVEDLSSVKKKLKIEVPFDRYQKERVKAYQGLNKKVSIPGFRKGKAPQKILEKYYGYQVERDVTSDLIEKAYQEAISENKIFAVSHPKIDDLNIEEGKDITFVAEVEVQPDVVVKDYKGIKLKKDELKVDAQEIDKELAQLALSMANQIPVDEGEEVNDGHVVTVDYEAFRDGQAMEGIKAKDAVLEVGKGQFLPDFEKGLLNMKKGDEKDIPVQFPEDYPKAELAGTTTTFKIKLVEHKKKDVPAIDDELAKDLGKFDSLADLKADIEKNILAQKENHQKSELFQEAIDYLIKKNKFEVPESMIERELEHMYQNTVRDIQMQGYKPEQVGLSVEKFKEENKEVSEKRIRSFLLIDAVAREEKIEVQAEDIEERLKKVAEQYGQPLENIRRYYQEQNLITPLINQILGDKVYDLLLSEAKLK